MSAAETVVQIRTVW